MDGLEIASWDVENFEAMQRAGLAGVGWTCAVWENFVDTLERIAEMLGWFRRLPAVLRPVRSVGDIVAAHEAGAVGMYLVFQNTSPIEDRIERLALFRELGVRMMQLTYNTQNLVGAGCYEDRDSGLTRFGHEVVEEMNDLGIVIDLSHVGPRTTSDAIASSRQPVVFSHVCPRVLKEHPRNKTDEEMRRVAEGGGLVGVTLFPPFLPSGNDSSVEEFVDVVEHVVGVCGEESVAIGSDFIDGHGAEFLEWLNRDKGTGRFVGGSETIDGLVKVRMPRGVARIQEFPNIRSVMERRGWREERVARLLGQNWLRLFGDVWRDDERGRPGGAGLGEEGIDAEAGVR